MESTEKGNTMEGMKNKETGKGKSTPAYAEPFEVEKPKKQTGVGVHVSRRFLKKS